MAELEQPAPAGARLHQPVVELSSACENSFMNRLYLAGVALFLVSLAGFLVFLPDRDRPGSDLSDRDLSLASQPGGNKTPLTHVVTETPDAVPSSPARKEYRDDGEDGQDGEDGEEAEKGLPIETADLSGYEAGDSITLYIPQEDASYGGTVTEATATVSGNRVLTGFLEGKYRFVLTVGRFQTFGTIQTGEGRYQMETRGGEGRIVSMAEINEGLDFTQPDYVIPDRPELPPAERRGG